jgi:hypothetical protein
MIDGFHNACGLRERVLDYGRRRIVRYREDNSIL